MLRISAQPGESEKAIELCSSRMVEFLIENDNVTYSVYENALLRNVTYSAFENALLCNGNDALRSDSDNEAQIRKKFYDFFKNHGYNSHRHMFIWPDVERAEFGRFVQFLYTGNYHDPEPVLRDKSDGKLDHSYYPHASYNYQKVAGCGECPQLYHDIRESYLDVQEHLRGHYSSSPTLTNQSGMTKDEFHQKIMKQSHLSYKEKLSCHIRMFHFASRYNIENLGFRVNQYLESILYDMICFDDCAEEVVDVIREYLEPNCPHESWAAADINSTLATYAACYPHQFWDDERFVCMMRKHPIFHGYFTGCLVHNI